VSLILEALRKSEEENQAPETPTLRPAYNKVSPPQPRPFVRQRNTIGIFVILSSLLVIGILYRSILVPSDYSQYGADDKNQNNQNQLTKTNISHHLSKGYDNPLESGLSNMKPPEKHHTSTSPQVINTTLSLPQIEPNAASGIAQPVAPSHAEEPTLPQLDEPKGQDITPQVATTSSEIYLLDTPNVKEISPQIQKQLPKLRYESHWYDKQPSKRIVIINSYNLKEGVRLSHNLRVHSITKDGCILSYKGVLFHMLMLESWPEIDQAIY